MPSKLRANKMFEREGKIKSVCCDIWLADKQFINRKNVITDGITTITLSTIYANINTLIISIHILLVTHIIQFHIQIDNSMRV